MGLSRRKFLREFGIGSTALTFSPFFLQGLERAFGQGPTVRVYKVMNGDCFQNTAKILEMMGGIGKYIGATDSVVIKGSAQAGSQGYTHTGCIKGVIDQVLNIQNFSGEVFICDNAQNVSSAPGFDAAADARTHNWPDHNWTTLAAEYQANGKPVAAKRWHNQENEDTPQTDISGPADGEGWIRSFFNGVNDRDNYLSYPIFESPLTSGRMIDPRNGVWAGGAYTGEKVKTIFMPTLNNHGQGAEDTMGVTSAIKSFIGATEILYSIGHAFRGYLNMHVSAYNVAGFPWIGGLTARYIQTLYAPVLYVTAAMWAGYHSRSGAAAETKTVLACENPATLDYVACRDVLHPAAEAADFPEYTGWLNPDNDNKTRRSILGAVNSGVGTITPGEFEIISYDFANPSVTRLDIDRKIKAYREGGATEQEVKDLIREYMETP
jgi:hypothetical protein